MATYSGKVALITGASSGIGEALAREYVRQGARVALLARRTDKLEALCLELGRERAIAITCDVTRDGQLETAVQRTVAELGRLDVAIANAGGGITKHFTRLTLDDYRSQVELNVFGVLRTVQAALPELQKTGGAVGVVGSVMGYLPLPAASPYSMSKAAVRSLAECLRVDLAPLGVSVTHVAPGFIDTELRRKKHGDKDPIPSWLVMSAPTAAKKIARAVRRRKRELVLTGHGKIGVFFGLHFAGLTSAVMALGARRGKARLRIKDRAALDASRSDGA